jgi:hypothetical protein
MENTELPDLNFERKIKLGYSKIHGRGVFATEDIKPGELVERAPLFILAHRMNYHKDPVIWGYMFTNTCPCDECKKHGGHFLMVSGYCQLYNHMDDNNAHISFDLKTQVAEIKSIKSIKKGEEIFINYGPKYFNNREKFAVDEYGNPIKTQNNLPDRLGELQEIEEASTTTAKSVFKPL